jgi:hypothetical protein
MLAATGHFKAAVARKYEDVDNTGTPEINCIRSVKRCTELCKIKPPEGTKYLFTQRKNGVFSILAYVTSNSKFF